MTHALLEVTPPSPAIDAAGNCALLEDQRGAGRVPVGVCDSGAFEFIGCEDLVLAQAVIVGSQTWETCHTALLGPDLIVEGNLSMTAGSQVAVRNGSSFAELQIIIDPALQITSPESLRLQGRDVPTSGPR